MLGEGRQREGSIRAEEAQGVVGCQPVRIVRGCLHLPMSPAVQCYGRTRISLRKGACMRLVRVELRGQPYAPPHRAARLVGLTTPLYPQLGLRVGACLEEVWSSESEVVGKG
eukprot:341813-Rhodomonas_salina.1